MKKLPRRYVLFYLAILWLSWTQARADDLKPRVIVFVHGLHGDRETWRGPNEAYWPDMIRVDPHFQHSDVFVAAYPTPSSSGQYSTTQLAQRLWQQLKDNRVWDHREVVFIAHLARRPYHRGDAAQPSGGRGQDALHCKLCDAA